MEDWTPTEAYEAGRTDPEAPRYSNAVLAVAEATELVASWKAAAGDHGETMRAYWLGRLRTARDQWHTQGGGRRARVAWTNGRSLKNR